MCPDLQLVQVPTAHGKADLTLYRNMGKKVRLPLEERRFGLAASATV